MEILSVQNLSKTHTSGGRSLTVLHAINFTVEAGSIVSIVGPSGSGKTTLLGLCAGLDRSSSGSVELNNVKLDSLNEDQRAQVRNKYVGFIFQNFQLLPTLTALENVMVPLELRGEKNVEPKAKELLDRVGLADRFHHFPTQLSGGEQQRLAIARALLNHPELILADEPSGNLDPETSNEIMNLFFDLSKSGCSVIMATHNYSLIEKFPARIVKLEQGKVTEN